MAPGKADGRVESGVGEVAVKLVAMEAARLCWTMGMDALSVAALINGGP